MGKSVSYAIRRARSNENEVLTEIALNSKIGAARVGELISSAIPELYLPLMRIYL